MSVLPLLVSFLIIKFLQVTNVWISSFPTSLFQNSFYEKEKKYCLTQSSLLYVVHTLLYLSFRLWRTKLIIFTLTPTPRIKLENCPTSRVWTNFMTPLTPEELQSHLSLNYYLIRHDTQKTDNAIKLRCI